ncbi:MAG: hypothetical protein EP329_02560 [Deltaproteobacteria bacterium]|nr:MAG: hypothetical protein EP329_02560 [Deltaproteobacteria bacterium]
MGGTSRRAAGTALALPNGYRQWRAAREAPSVQRPVTRRWTIALALGLLLALSGCIEPQSQLCASGVICPYGKRCNDFTGSCVGPDEGICGDELVEADEECDDGPGNSDTTADACRTSCRAAGCGDGWIDSGEVCDDGNREDGDGCASDCRSDERCGNGRLDAVKGEGCDDGNLRSFDGCSSACTAEVPIWEPMALAARPARRSLALMAADRDTGRVFLYGGRSANGQALDDLWEYDGTAWRALATGGPPAAMARTAADYVASKVDGWTDPSDDAGGALVFERGADRLLLVLAGETWTWDDGDGWRLRALDGAADGASFALAYDTGRQRAVLYDVARDGFGAVPTGRTRLFDGLRWEPLSEGDVPGPLASPTMAHHEQLGIVVMLGYERDASGVPDDLKTWLLYPAAGWIPFEASPIAGGGWTLVEAGDGVHLWPGTTVGNLGTVLEGGLGTGFDHVWTFESAGWSRLQLATQLPLAETGAAVVELRGQGLLFGGLSSQFQPLDTTWTYTWGEGWRAAPDDGLPPGRRAAGLAYVPPWHRTVLFGGTAGADTLGDTWELADGAWRVRHDLAYVPAPRDHAAMAWDGAAGRVVLAGGGHVPGYHAAIDETWSYTEGGWTLTDAASGYRASGQQVVYDGARGRLVAYGGSADLEESPAFVPTFRTRELIAGRWAPVATAHDPRPRAFHALGYDPLRERVVLFGGEAPTWAGGQRDPRPLGDTWEYDGTDWTLIRAHRSPSARVGATLTWNEARGRLVLHGGQPGRGEPPLSDTWEYDGRSWYPVATATRGPEVTDHRMVYDAGLRALVMVGELTTGPSSWTFAVRGAAVPERCDAASDDDGDGWAACDDPDCNGDVACPVRERCANGVDDDGDGAVDCADPNCGGLPCGDTGQTCVAGACTCLGGEVELACDDGVDDDCDGAFDCDDPDCAGACDGPARPVAGQ